MSDGKISRPSSRSHGDGNNSFFRAYGRQTLAQLFVEDLRIVPDLPSSIIFGAMIVKIPSGDMVDVTDSGLTPCGILTRRRNLMHAQNH